MSKLIIDGNAIYEIDEDCMKERERCSRTIRNKKDEKKKEHITDDYYDWKKGPH